jgi:hypothetical protein
MGLQVESTKTQGFFNKNTRGEGVQVYLSRPIAHQWIRLDLLSIEPVCSPRQLDLKSVVAIL